MTNTTVLIVDQSETFRNILKRFLTVKYPKLRIFEAENMSLVSNILQTTPPDLILMDIHFPDGNGFQLIKRIKDQYPQTIIFIVTSHDSTEYREAADQYGAGGFFSKNSSTLNAIIKAVRSATAQDIT